MRVVRGNGAARPTCDVHERGRGQARVGDPLFVNVDLPAGREVGRVLDLDGARIAGRQAAVELRHRQHGCWDRWHALDIPVDDGQHLSHRIFSRVW